MIQVVVRDKDGKVIKRLRRVSKSYVRQFIDVMQVQMSQLAGSAVDTGGTARALTAASTAFRVCATAGTATYGIQVGTGTTAVNISDYKLATQIAHGTGSGQLSHGAVSVGTVSIVGSTAQFTIARTFTNNSGASITVNEVGLVTLIAYSHLIERSLLTFAIPNGGSGTVTYTIKVTV